MKIQPIRQTSLKHKFNPNYAKISGYCTVASGVSSVIAAYNKKAKLHKNLALLTGLFAAAHIFVLEYNKYKFLKLVEKD